MSVCKSKYSFTLDLLKCLFPRILIFENSISDGSLSVFFMILFLGFSINFRCSLAAISPAKMISFFFEKSKTEILSNSGLMIKSQNSVDLLILLIILKFTVWSSTSIKLSICSFSFKPELVCTPITKSAPISATISAGKFASNPPSTYSPSSNSKGFKIDGKEMEERIAS